MNLFSAACPKCGARIPWYRISNSSNCKACGEPLAANTLKAILVAIVVALPFEAVIHLAIEPTVIQIVLKTIVGLGVIAWSLSHWAELRICAKTD